MNIPKVSSNEAVLYNALCANYPAEVLPLTKISHNTNGARDFIVSAELALSFDEVKNCSSAYAFENNEKSPDALFLHEDILYFVEFKEGNPKQVKKVDIRNKIHEGILTLYHFAKKYTAISKVDFFKLKIAYIVFRRPYASGNSFTDAIQAASANYFIENIKGFLVGVTVVSDEPQFFVDFFHRVSSGKITQINVFDHNGSGIQQLYTATAVQSAMSTAANATPLQSGADGAATA
ncbi:hypothetical protein [Pectobacterium polaris]|uniref:hypothetical protein n=1 Tax=Pectobacterium polaris TaxID=2042057 RepID=UPI001968BC9C|nr:hypothetical protein [Pectobacterium polaris]MBN3215058.1 hypothetical protein [Pectobacterium polaris]